MPENISLHGFDGLEKALNELPDAIAKKIAQQSVRKGAVIIQHEAQARAPIRQGGEAKKIGGKRSKTGRLPGYLRASILVRLRRVPGAAVTYSIGWSKRGFYGMFLEFGTRFIAARPFMRPAADTKFQEAVNAIGADLGPKIEREAKRLAG